MQQLGTPMSGGYYPRIADEILNNKLNISGAVHIKGPKWCGKTSTAERASESAIYLQDPDRGPALLAMADSKPSALLKGDEPRLIDEWQMAPQLWDAVRYEIDRGHGRGRFILTGSSIPKARPAHSGVGRIAPMVMRTMSLQESADSSGDVSLSELFSGEADNIESLTDCDIENYAGIVCRGGWPEAVIESAEYEVGAMAREYVEELLDYGIDEIDGVKRNRQWMSAILRSYARNVSSQANLSTIMADMQGESPSDTTVAEYIDALSRAYVVEDLEAWNPSLRSKTAVRTSRTRHFCDPSVAASVLGVRPGALMDDFETFGLLFESLCIRDLRVYADGIGAKVYHYRDKTGLEADAVLVMGDGRWAPVEVKMGQSKIDEGAKNLLKLADRVDARIHGNPAFMMILTSTTAAYRRSDGVYIVPLACLGV